MNNIFRIKKEERLFALITLIVIIAFNVLMITYHFDDFGKPKAGFWTLFTKNFQISGFDPYTYLTLSKWKVYYTEYRHPMLPFFLYPFSLLYGIGGTGKGMGMPRRKRRHIQPLSAGDRWFADFPAERGIGGISADLDQCIIVESKAEYGYGGGL